MGPTVIIGLGGVGSEIVAMVEEHMNHLPADLRRKLRPLMRFAIVDTDVSALRERRKKDFSGAVVQISDNMTVEKYRYADKSDTEWFPPCQILSRKTLTEGAGQVRAISRLALNVALQNPERLKPLYTAIDELHLMGEYNSEQPTRVVIVSSLAGGTGSGIFLPFAMHLQDYLRQNYRNTEPIFKGFFAMPSVFDFVAEPVERRSLNANGYAAVKELNAFTLLRDRQIEAWRYPELKIELPNGHGQKRKYYESPFDLCFLFEKQNQDDKHLRGFEETKRNIASCVWMQTVNPVLEENGSLEDNLFKIVSTASEHKRYERFAGMGIAQLRYPYQDMEPYFSIVMAETIVKNDWYAADLAWEKQLAVWETEGEDIQQIKKEEFYRDFAENRGEWEKLIHNARTGGWVGDYLESVKQLVTARFDESKGDKFKKLQRELDVLTKEGYNRSNWGPKRIQFFEEAHDQILREQRLVLAKNKDFIYQRVLAEFQPPKKNQPDWKGYQIEYWLLGRDEAKTPIENRYFLAQLEHELQAQREKLEKEIEELRPSDEEYNAAIKQIREIVDHSGKKGAFETSVDKLKAAVANISERFSRELLSEVYRDILRRVNALWQVYDVLLREYIEWVNEEKVQIKKNLLDRVENHDGQTVRLVCCSGTCLDRMEAIVRHSARHSELEAAFAEQLCMEVLRQQQKGADASTDRLKRFWVDNYTKVAGAKLDVDVLTALENEACWEYEKTHKKALDKSDASYNDIVARYMKEEAFGKLQNIFVRAFLRIPNALERHTMQMCIYPSDIPKDDVFLNMIVDKELKKNHGYEDKEGASGGKYQVDFYRAIFGVSAGEVSAFLHEDGDSPHPSGSGYRDYMGMVNSLDWQNRRENFLTPHIDRRWHKTTSIPELSAEYGKTRYGSLLSAVLFGLFVGKITYENDVYQVRMLNGQAFDCSHDLTVVKTFSELVGFVDESPIIWAYLEDLKRYPSKWEKQPEKMRKEMFDRAIGECADRKLAQNFSYDEAAKIMEDVMLELVYIMEIKGKYHELGQAVEIATSKTRELLADNSSGTEHGRQMKEQMNRYLTDARIAECLSVWMKKPD